MQEARCPGPQTHPLATPRLNESQRQALENQITELAAHIHAATARLLELIRRFDEGGGWHGGGLRSCAHWLNYKCGINIGAAREKVRVARALADLPLTTEKFRHGEISYSKVRAMTRVATAKNEPFLLMIARHGTAAHMERLVRQYRSVKRMEALALDKHKHRLRECSWYRDHDGMWVCKVRLDAEQGALVQARLEASLAELDAEQKGCPEASTERTVEDYIKQSSTPVAQRRADALVRLARCGTVAAGGDAHLVHVHTTMEVLKADGTEGQSEIEGCGNVSAETSRRLACDTGVVHWQEDDNGNALNIGRKSRSVPPALRRALQRRDGGCRFPGCTGTRFLHAHHITHWADGGETSLANLVLLCSHHHRLVHEGGFDVRMRAGGELRFTHPDGRTLRDNGEPCFRGNVFQLMRQNRSTNPDINHRSGECRWQGEHMDDNMAMSIMLQLE